MSTFPFLQNPSAQQIINFLDDACNPNSNRDIGDFVFGSKYITIISAISRWSNSQSTCSTKNSLDIDCFQLESQSFLLGLKKIISLSEREFTIFFCQSSAIPISIEPAKNIFLVVILRLSVFSGALYSIAFML